jgi:hypothetical protein
LAGLAILPAGILPQNPPAAPVAAGNPTAQEAANAVAYARLLQQKRGQYNPINVAFMPLWSKRSGTHY